MMHFARHITASGSIDECWSFDPEDHRVDALVRIGARSLAIVIFVCSHERPRLGAHPITRIDGETWRVVPDRFVHAFPHRVPTLTAIRCPIGDVLDPGDSLVLSNTPDDVTRLLEAL